MTSISKWTLILAKAKDLPFKTLGRLVIEPIKVNDFNRKYMPILQKYLEKVEILVGLLILLIKCLQIQSNAK